MTWKLAKGLAQLIVLFLLAVVIVQGQVQKPRPTNAKAYTDSATVQQPLYSEYKGVRIGMSADEAHARLGNGMRIDDQELFVFNDHESAQLLFNTANKVMAISIDYLGGIGAPDYRAVVGPDIYTKPDGSLFKMVRYEQLGFWVSYSRTATTPVFMVSITIQKIP
jgi:hypothetical protein